MKWLTRPGCHVDRVACAWLILRFIDVSAVFEFVDDLEDLPEGATPFDIPGVELSHHGPACTFETMLQAYALQDPSLADVGRIVHEADIGDERYDAPEAAGIDVMIRGMALVFSDEEMISACMPLFDGLYEFRRQTNAVIAPS